MDRVQLSLNSGTGVKICINLSFFWSEINTKKTKLFSAQYIFIFMFILKIPLYTADGFPSTSKFCVTVND